MFSKLFAESGLSLDRLKALLAVAAAGSIVKATGGDPVRQSQYSRQIKELEDFFRVKLVERHGKGIRLTPQGKELARISRFFMLGLSNFQRGCLTEEQTFRIGASTTFIRQFALPAISSHSALQRQTRYIFETVGDDEIERRLHDLTLDFGVTTRTEPGRPLQLKELGKWRLKMWAPRALRKNLRSVAEALKHKCIPLVLAKKELDLSGANFFDEQEPRLTCDSFLEAVTAIHGGNFGAVLPDFLSPGDAKEFIQVDVPGLQARAFHFRLAWNPRLLRLNPHAVRRRDFLARAFADQMKLQHA